MISVIFCSCGNKGKESGTDEVVIVTPSGSKAPAEKEKEDLKSTESKDSSDNSSSKGSPSTNAGSVKKELPEKFPEDMLPLVEGAKITQSTSFKDIGGTVMYTAGKPLDEVYKFYKAKLENLDKYNEMLNNGTWNFYAVTEGYRFVVIVTPTGENSVQVMLTAKLED